MNCRHELIALYEGRVQRLADLSLTLQGKCREITIYYLSESSHFSLSHLFLWR